MWLRGTLRELVEAQWLTRWLVIEENGVRLRLNIVDTPGYGDQVNNDRWYETVFELRAEDFGS